MSNSSTKTESNQSETDKQSLISSYPIIPRNNKRIQETFDKALKEHPRTLIVRVDLYLPDTTYNSDSTLMTKFIASLNAQIATDIQKRINSGVRVHPCSLRYIWAREFHRDGRKHYHIALFLNKDTYAYPGTFHPDENGKYHHNLSLMIMEAWVRTLKLNTKDNHQKYYNLINFPKNCYYHLDKNKMDFLIGNAMVLNRLSYLAKEYTKDYSDKQRNFGCSQY
ncbi:inovirus Gp2 family protein [Serratia nevei]|nr:inovirus Gp2 family protein [Serratia nevei]